MGEAFKAAGVDMELGTRQMLYRMSEPDLMMSRLMLRSHAARLATQEYGRQYARKIGAGEDGTGDKTVDFESIPFHRRRQIINERFTEEERNAIERQALATARRQFTNAPFWQAEAEYYQTVGMAMTRPHDLRIQRIHLYGLQGAEGVPDRLRFFDYDDERFGEMTFRREEYRRHLYSAPISDLSSMELNWRKQRDNLTFERSLLERQERILSLQHDIENKRMRMQEVGLQSTAIQILHEKKSLEFGAQQLDIAKRRDVVQTRVSELDLERLRLQARHAPMLAHIEREKAVVGLESKKRELMIEREMLPLRREQMGVNLESQRLSLDWQRQDIAFRRWYDTMMYGDIGADRSYRAYIDMSRGQLAEQRSRGLASTSLSSIYNQTLANMGRAPVFGLQHEQFYEGLVHQMRMLQYGRSAFRTEAAYSEQMRHLEKQAEFYERRMEIEDRAREHSYRLQEQQLVLAEKQYEVLVKILELQMRSLEGRISDTERLLPSLMAEADIQYEMGMLDASQMEERVELAIRSMELEREARRLAIAIEEENLAYQRKMLAFRIKMYDLEKEIFEREKLLVKEKQDQELAQMEHRKKMLEFDEEVIKRQEAILESHRVMDETSTKMSSRMVEVYNNLVKSLQFERRGERGVIEGRVMDPATFIRGIVEAHMGGIDASGIAVSEKALTSFTGNWQDPAFVALLEAMRSGRFDESMRQAFIAQQTTEDDRLFYDRLISALENDTLFRDDLYTAITQLTMIAEGEAQAPYDETVFDIRRKKSEAAQMMGWAAPFGELGSILQTTGDIALTGWLFFQLLRPLLAGIGIGAAGSGAAGAAGAGAGAGAGAALSGLLGIGGSILGGLILGHAAAKDIGIKEGVLDIPRLLDEKIRSEFGKVISNFSLERLGGSLVKAATFLIEVFAQGVLGLAQFIAGMFSQEVKNAIAGWSQETKKMFDAGYALIDSTVEWFELLRKSTGEGEEAKEAREKIRKSISSIIAMTANLIISFARSFASWIRDNRGVLEAVFTLFNARTAFQGLMAFSESTLKMSEKSVGQAIQEQREGERGVGSGRGRRDSLSERQPTRGGGGGGKPGISFAIGILRVPEDQVVQVHRGEAILDVNAAEAYRSMIAQFVGGRGLQAFIDRAIALLRDDLSHLLNSIRRESNGASTDERRPVALHVRVDADERREPADMRPAYAYTINITQHLSGDVDVDKAQQLKRELIAEIERLLSRIKNR
jgi:hypothetical protein